MNTVSRNHRSVAALVLACLAGFGAQLNAEDLILQRADGSTITQIPLLSSNGCTVVAGGDIAVRPQPTAGTSGDGWCPEGGGPGPSFTQQLQVSPLNIGAGGQVSATWAATAVTTCTGSATFTAPDTTSAVATTVAGWTGPRAISQAAPGLSVTLPSQGVYVLMMTCANGAGTTVNSSALGVTVGTPPPIGCTNGTPRYGLVQQTSMQNTNTWRDWGNDEHPVGPLNITQWSVIAPADPWPTRTQRGLISVTNGNFVALEFNTGSFTPEEYGTGPNARYGNIKTIAGAPQSGAVLISISKCPGGFFLEDLPPAADVGGTGSNSLCLASGLTFGSFIWSVGVADAGACQLKENQRYYVNIAFVSPSTGLTNCTGSACSWYTEPR